MIENIKIPIPVTKSRGLDLKAQEEIASLYLKIEEIKSLIIKELNELYSTKIIIE